jgi:CheY-like chemotaxis protein
MEIADALLEAGWEVIEATSGEAALELLENRRRVELLVTDIRLPGRVNGWDVADKYRATYKEVMVIYCSGNPVDETGGLLTACFCPNPAGLIFSWTICHGR